MAVGEWVKKMMPRPVYDKIRSVLTFRPGDPNKLHQVLPQRVVHEPEVPRIQGFRFPSPGSQGVAKVPKRDSLDDVYDTSYLTRDPTNLKEEGLIGLNSHNEVTMIGENLGLANVRLPSHGKRQIASLNYDPTGLRTTKTITWDKVDAVLEANAKPDHLPGPEWANDIDAIYAEAEKKGLPPPMGKRLHLNCSSKNYNTVRW